ncbi:UNVERIFIED_CONTAM: hypothetical protein GTU68_017229 [Idotea baltica]|nr:hypothetical protein [Idotea baltica]
MVRYSPILFGTNWFGDFVYVFFLDFLDHCADRCDRLFCNGQSGV